MPPGECTVLGQPSWLETQDGFFCGLAGRSAPTGLPVVHWIGCINTIKIQIWHMDVASHQHVLYFKMTLNFHK